MRSSACHSLDLCLFVLAGSASSAGTESQAPTTLLGRAQEAVVHAAAATSAAGTTLVNKVCFRAHQVFMHSWQHVQVCVYEAVWLSACSAS